ncbi:MAG: Mrp/NBP35 family ATP-binding protein [bacterium]|nr:Mrp/NBP35 family ATP-binding protein [Candidatus Sumerlaeota bacterium]
MPVDRDAIYTALKTVEDPDLGRDLVSLNMIKDVEIDDNGRVNVTVVLTTPACPLKARIEQDVKAAVMRAPGVKRVTVNMGSDVSPMQRPPEYARTVRNIIGIASGKGGVGKSTVAVNAAIALAQSGARVGLLDADMYGPNIPLMLGMCGEQPQIVSRKGDDGADIDMIIPPVKHGIKVMSMGFLTGDDTPVIWRGPMLNSALRQFLRQVDWGDLDYLIVDLPPGTGDIQISLIQLVRVTGIVHVTTPQQAALQDVRKTIMMFLSQNIPLLGVVENMSYFVCPHCHERTEIFSCGGGEQLAAEYGIAFLGSIPLAPEVRAAGDDGTPVVVSNPGSVQARKLIGAAEQLAAQVSKLNYRRSA